MHIFFLLILCVAGEAVLDEADGVEVDSAVGFNARILLVLKGKTSPETRLSNEELQVRDQCLFIGLSHIAYR